MLRMSLILQEVVQIPKLVNFMSLDGERVIQLPTNAKIKVRSNRGNVYEAPITNKTVYRANELMDRTAKFNATVDTEKWIITNITMISPIPERSVKEEREEYSTLMGDY